MKHRVRAASSKVLYFTSHALMMVGALLATPFAIASVTLQGEAEKLDDELIAYRERMAYAISKAHRISMTTGLPAPDCQCNQCLAKFQKV